MHSAWLPGAFAPRLPALKTRHHGGLAAGIGGLTDTAPGNRVPLIGASLRACRGGACLHPARLGQVAKKMGCTLADQGHPMLGRPALRVERRQVARRFPRDALACRRFTLTGGRLGGGLTAA